MLRNEDVWTWMSILVFETSTRDIYGASKDCKTVTEQLNLNVTYIFMLRSNDYISIFYIKLFLWKFKIYNKEILFFYIKQKKIASLFVLSQYSIYLRKAYKSYYKNMLKPENQLPGIGNMAKRILK